jgi:hypothetical protein
MKDCSYGWIIVVIQDPDGRLVFLKAKGEEHEGRKAMKKLPGRKTGRTGTPEGQRQQP